MRNWDKFSSTTYDLAVIGGGINGSAIAYLARKRGLRVILVEKGDFGSGTSSKSSKLMHGGLRYLEQFQFKLVYQALHERSYHVKHYAHLVKPLPFLIPVYEHDKRPLWKMKIGVFLYDILSGRHRIGRHGFLSREQMLEAASGLRQQGLVGGVCYYDAQMDDFRLCLENILAAKEAGCDVLNYAEVTGFIYQNRRIYGIEIKDNLVPNAPETQILARRVVCAAGPWANKILQMDQPGERPQIRTTKGIHLICPGKISDSAFLIPAEQDGRIFFILPWDNKTMIGTTDTDYHEDPDKVKVEPEDVEYLVRETKRVFPEFKFPPYEQIRTFAGLRPLLNEKGNPSQVSREHSFFETISGILVVAGGKYTTYRVVAEEFVNRIVHGPSFNDFPTKGSGKLKESAGQLSLSYKMEEKIVKELVDFYGPRVKAVLDFTLKNELFKEILCHCCQFITAEIAYAVQVEFAKKVEDLFDRRFLRRLSHCQNSGCRDTILVRAKNFLK